VLVDAAHNPGGAEVLAVAITEYFTFDKVVAVLGILADKDVEGIVRALEPVVTEFVVTDAPSDRAIDADSLAAIVVGIVGRDRVSVEPELARALESARDSADEAERGAVLVTGSITLVGEAITLAAAEKWKP
jgi:dihydrofolate synthase/folylpolyglutamate synthase